MFFLVLGLALLTLKWLALGPVADLSWWWVLLPFALAAIWWTLSDHLGFTARQQAARDEARKRKRIDAQRDRLRNKPGSRR